MLGELWRFPFEPQVWGNVAEWAGAIGTVSAAFAAVWIYKNSVRREQRAQAHHVSFIGGHYDKKTDTFHAHVNNFSDQPIFEVTPIQNRKPFREVIFHEYEIGRRPTTTQITELRGRWEETRGGTFQVLSVEGGKVKPGETKDVTFKGTRSVAGSYSVQFRDSLGQTWNLELDEGKPTFVEYDEPPCPWWHIILHPRCMIAQRKKQNELNYLVDQALKDERAD